MSLFLLWQSREPYWSLNHESLNLPLLTQKIEVVTLDGFVRRPRIFLFLLFCLQTFDFKAKKRSGPDNTESMQNFNILNGE